MFKPNKVQAQALVAFAAAAGHQWRSKLRNVWCSDRVLANKQDQYAALRQIRNEAGPNWLHQVKLEDLKRLANPGLEDNGKARLGAEFGTAFCGDFTLRKSRLTGCAELVCEGHGSILIGPGELADLASVLCLGKEEGYVS